MIFEFNVSIGCTPRAGTVLSQSSLRAFKYTISPIFGTEEIRGGSRPTQQCGRLGNMSQQPFPYIYLTLHRFVEHWETQKCFNSHNTYFLY